MARILTQKELASLTRKPANINSLGAVLLTQERLDTLIAQLPTLQYDRQTLSAIDDAIEAETKGTEDEDSTEFLLDGPRGLILVDTSGYSYARFAVQIGIAPVPRKPAPETAAQAATRHMAAIQTYLGEIGDTLRMYHAEEADWSNTGDLGRWEEALKDVADCILGRA